VLFSLLYNGPLVILGAFWLRSRVREFDRLQILPVLLDVAIVSIAVARFYGSSIPPSGHALFLTHSLVSVNKRYYRFATLVMLIVTIGLKISWGDYTSWGYGILLGIASGRLWMWAGTKRDNDVRPSER
jgi:hypothetical protein